jgi:acyl dehydratase
MPARFYEDYSIGDVFETPSHHVTEAEILDFGRQFDPQAFHTDPEAARHGFFGRLIASGWHTAAVTMRLLTACELVPAGGLIGREVRQLEWPLPVLPDDVLTAIAEVSETLESRSRPEIGLIRARVETRNQHGDAVQIMKPLLIVPRRP